MKIVYMLRTLEGIKKSFRLRGKIFHMQVSVYSHCVQLIIFRTVSYLSVGL